MSLVVLSQRIRELRKKRGMTLEQLSIQTDLTQSVLSKVENFRVTPSLPAVSRIAEALGTTLAELFEGIGESPSITITRKSEQVRVERDRPNSVIEYFSLNPQGRNRVFNPMLLTVPCGEPRKEALPHEGEEFLYVVSGRVDLEYDRERFALKAGDSAIFDGAINHRLINPYAKPATVLCVFSQ